MESAIRLFENKLILAPMSTLSFRLLASEMGADLVYTEEMVGFKVSTLTRHYDEETRLIEYKSKDGKTQFSTMPEEKSRLIFQLGVPNSTLALKSAQIVESDVSGVDINMGCPKEFSIHAGMGASLLKNMDVACDIVKTLTDNISVPVSCKIRLLDGEIRNTIDFAKALEKSGCKALTIHARFTSERPRNKAHWDMLPIIKDNLSIPVILNGDIFEKSDIIKAKEITGYKSIMIARGALKNISIFKKEKDVNIEDIVKLYVDKSVKVKNKFSNTKYTVLEMLKLNNIINETPGLKATQSKNFSDLYNIFGSDPIIKKAKL